jgi:hypothetical protein
MLRVGKDRVARSGKHLVKAHGEGSVTRTYQYGTHGCLFGATPPQARHLRAQQSNPESFRGGSLDLLRRKGSSQ